MSADHSIAELFEYGRPSNGVDRYVKWAEAALGVTLAPTQKQILRSLAENKRTLIMSGNGVGKSFGVTLGILAFMKNNPNPMAMLTSGSYSMLNDTTWRPMSALHNRLIRDYPIYGGEKKENPPRIEYPDNPQRYFKAISPKNPDGLEGRHAEHVLVVIEEADKPEITHDHFDSAGSSITDENDRFLAVCNPPRDETNVVYDKLNSDRWNVIEFSSFDSHNVQVETGNLDSQKIDGLVDLDLIIDDYEDWNRESWPGLQDVLDTMEYDPEKGRRVATREDLDQRWYRRRLGVIPPDGADALRPWYTQDVDQAVDRYESYSGKLVSATATGVGMDVARKGGDSNVIACRKGPYIHIKDRWKGLDHTQNEDRFVDNMEDIRFDGKIAIDAIGEGSAVADNLKQKRGFRGGLIRFNSGSEAIDSSEYRNKRTEALAQFGKFLRNGGMISHRDLKAEAYAAARSVELEERALKADTVFLASPKEVIKERLGRSPDLLDASIMAIWASLEGARPEEKQKKPPKQRTPYF